MIGSVNLMRAKICYYDNIHTWGSASTTWTSGFFVFRYSPTPDRHAVIHTYLSVTAACYTVYYGEILNTCGSTAQVYDANWNKHTKYRTFHNIYHIAPKMLTILAKNICTHKWGGVSQQCTVSEFTEMCALFPTC